MLADGECSVLLFSVPNLEIKGIFKTSLPGLKKSWKLVQVLQTFIDEILKYFDFYSILEEF